MITDSVPKSVSLLRKQGLKPKMDDGWRWAVELGKADYLWPKNSRLVRAFGASSLLLGAETNGWS